MHPSLDDALRLLACPVCYQGLRREEAPPVDRAGERAGELAIELAVVRCSGCGRKYPVADGIPVLIASRASF